MRKNKKGFTLIELLAVIVILAIIATIATPIILNIISTSREKAHDESVRLIIKNVELAYANCVIYKLGFPPYYQMLVDEYNSMMENTSWDSSENKIISDDISCSANIDNYILTVTCGLSDNTSISSRPLKLVSPWESRGLNLSNVVFDKPYVSQSNTDVIEFYSNGDLKFINSVTPSKDVDNFISLGNAVVLPDGFLLSMVPFGVDSYFAFVLTSPTTAKLYRSPIDIDFNKNSIINRATNLGSVHDYVLNE